MTEFHKSINMNFTNLSTCDFFNISSVWWQPVHREDGSLPNFPASHILRPREKKYCGQPSGEIQDNWCGRNLRFPLYLSHNSVLQSCYDYSDPTVLQSTLLLCIFTEISKLTYNPFYGWSGGWLVIGQDRLYSQDGPNCKCSKCLN